MITISNLSHAFQSRAGGTPLKVLDSISLSIADNKFVALLGPSGCGKTTLLRMLDGLILPSRGEIRIDDAPVKGPSPDRVMVFQEFNLLPWRSVRRNVEYPSELQGVSPSVYQPRVREMLKLVGLHQFEHYFPHQISGGMKQRVGLARALSMEPMYLLMDEPFGALDPLIREVMQVEMMKIIERSSKTIVIVTHSIDEAIFLADQIFVFSARPGRILERFDIDLPRPRWEVSSEVKATPEFARYRKEIWSLLQGEVHEAIQREARAS